MSYSLIYADPPWKYGNTISNGAAENHYGTKQLGFTPSHLYLEVGILNKRIKER